MPIIQLNVWICDKCGVIATTAEHTDIYEDPVVSPPTEGWGWRGNQLLCPKCMSHEHE